jgi:hypothetical protein
VGCAIWLLDPDGSTRWAAFWSLLVGLSRLVIPFVLAANADVGLATGEHYVNWHMLRIVLWFADAQMFVLGLMLWAVFARFVGESNNAGTVAHSMYAEAH